MNRHISWFNFILGLVVLVLVLALPSGITAWFDGLPWTGEAETLALSILIPFLLILGWRFLSLRLSILLLGALFILKTILFFGSPSSGWLVKVHPNFNEDSVNELLRKRPPKYSDGDSWVKTYTTNWNKKASGILQRPWTEKLDFPLDWALFGFGECGVTTMPCFDGLNPIIEIEGTLLLPEGKKFTIIAEGVQEGTLSATHENGESFILSPAKSFKEAAQQLNQLLKEGKWRISGKLLYQGTDWSLIPVWVAEDGTVSSDPGREFLWQDDAVLSMSEGTIQFYKYLSWVIDSLICLFFLAWIIWTGRSLIQKQILTVPLALFSALGILLPFIVGPIVEVGLAGVKLEDPTTHSHLGFSLIPVSIGFLIWTYWRKDFRNFQTGRIVLSVFLLFGPALLFFFTNKWWSSVGQWSIWGAGDDWTLYQLYARRIVVEGEWLLGGKEGAFQFQLLYRYFIGIYHWLFGQSAFVQHMADVWCVLGATTLLASWAVKLRLSALIVFITSSVYLMPELIGGFRYHIGRSLIEHHAMFFLVLAGWLLYDSREGHYLRIIGAGICGAIGYLLRQDHLFVTAALVFLIIEPTYGTAREVWRAYWEQVRTYWKRGFTYGGILAFGVFLEFFRNWWLCGKFSYTCMEIHPGLSSINLGTIYHFLTASEWPAIPQISAVLLLMGPVFGILALVWRPGFLRIYPASLGLVFIGYILPYFILWFASYPPRFSIHLLPLATLSVMIVLDSLCKSSRFGKYFR